MDRVNRLMTTKRWGTWNFSLLINLCTGTNTIIFQLFIFYILPNDSEALEYLGECVGRRVHKVSLTNCDDRPSLSAVSTLLRGIMFLRLEVSGFVVPIEAMSVQGFQKLSISCFFVSNQMVSPLSRQAEFVTFHYVSCGLKLIIKVVESASPMP